MVWLFEDVAFQSVIVIERAMIFTEGTVNML
jgi:hypothetical protein